jgi:SAM-dependent methyltransferase
MMINQPHDADTPPVTPKHILDLEWGFAKSASLMAALELGLFDQVALGADSPEKLARAVQISGRGASALMLAMAALGLLTCDEGRYGLSRDAAQYLRSGQPNYLGDMHRIFSGMNARIWPQLTNALRSGKPIVDLYVLDTNRHWDDIFPFLTAVSRPMARTIAQYVSKSLGGSGRFLDVGSGSGLYTCEVANATPGVQVISLDQPDVMPYMRRAIEAAGVSNRVTLRQGNIFALDWGADYDFILFSHLLHGFSIDACQKLIAKAAAAVRPGGELLIHEFMPDPVTPENRPIAALFGLEMLMTSHGDAYPAETYDRLVTEAGFAPITELPGPPGPTRFLSAYKHGRGK